MVKVNIWRKALTIIMSVSMLLINGVVAVKAKELDLKDHHTGWYVPNKEENPASGSYFSYYYGKNGNFYKMNYRDNTSDLKGFRPEKADDFEKITGWQQMVTDKRWIAFGFNIDKSGVVEGTSHTNIYEQYGTSELMIVLKNGETGLYSPVYPTPGEWAWKEISGTSASPTVLKDAPMFSTEYKKGDTLFYIVKPKVGIEKAGISIIPKVSMTYGETTAAYPTTFTGFENRAADSSLYPSVLNYNLSADEYNDENRRYQGLATIEVVKKDDGSERIWAGFLTGGLGEGIDNYELFSFSDDKGTTWSEPVFSLEQASDPHTLRNGEAMLWLEPTTQKLWLFWTQSYSWYDGRAGVWLSICDNPGADNPEDMVWSIPKRIADGFINTKPTVLSNGKILVPMPIWSYKEFNITDKSPNFDIPKRMQEVRVYETDVNASKFTYVGGIAPPDEIRLFDEPMIYQTNLSNPLELTMVMRVKTGLYAATSSDGGKTWQPSAVNDETNSFNFWDDGKTKTATSSRFYLARLKSGNLLMVYHNNTESAARINMTAKISKDNGATWEGGLLLSAKNTSYPDVTQGEDGRIYAIYDNEREWAREVQVSSFTEEDVINGATTSSNLNVVVNKAKGAPIYKDAKKFTNSWLFGDSGFNVNSTDSRVREWLGVHAYSYKQGQKGVYSPMTKFSTSDSTWTDATEKTKVGSWFMSATGENDAVNSWSAPGAGNISITTSFKDIYLTNSNGIANIMILQKRADNYYPLWPQKGVFEWKTISNTEKANIEAANAIATSVAEGDEIVMVLKGGSAQITFNPEITFTSIEADSQIVINPPASSLFTAWVDDTPVGPVEPDEIRYLHSWAFNESDKTAPNSTNINDTPAFLYKQGLNGSYQSLNKYSTEFNAWTLDDKNPLIGSYFLGGFADHDGVIQWTAPETGKVTMSSQLPIKKNAGNDSYFMIVQERDGKYLPLYPNNGEFVWQNVNSTTELTLPEIKTSVNKGDNIYVVVRSLDGVLEIDPDIKFLEGDSDALNFTAWDSTKDELLKLISQATALLSNDSSGSAKVKALKAELDKANAVLNNASATADSVNASVAALKAALDAYTDANTGGGDGDGNGGNGNGNGSGGNNTVTGERKRYFEFVVLALSMIVLVPLGLLNYRKKKEL